MSVNNTSDTAPNGEATIAIGRPTSGCRYRVQGSIRLTVTVTATSPDEATQAVPAAVTDVFAEMPATVTLPDGLGIGIPAPLPSDGTQPSRYQVPVTVHGHVDRTGDDEADMPDAALNAVAAHLDGREGVSADLDSAICDDVSEIVEEQPAE
jgi:hypothetical protein